MAIKGFRSPDYNYIFDTKTGYFARWGKTAEEDPQYAPYLELADIELTEICSGPAGVPCPMCYKANGPNSGDTMSLGVFKELVSKFGDHKPLQIAFGVDATGTSNPDMIPIMEYCRAQDIVPNVTLANISDDMADQLVKLCGAVAVSRYDDKNLCYDSVKRLTDRGLSQVNIHMVTHAGNIDQILETLQDIKDDLRLKQLNAIVFLALKQKGRGKSFKPASLEQFKAIVDKCFELGLSFGMDSCSAHKFLAVIKDHPQFEKLKTVVEPCESSLFSFYVDARGQAFPCSFAEEGKGIDVLACKDFSEVWNHPKTIEFRTKLLAGERKCPLFEV